MTDATSAGIPFHVRTTRLYLRQWHGEDACLLAPILETHVEHLRWIPTHVAAPGTVDEIAQRLEQFATDFAADRSWRFGVFAPDGDDIYGEIALFPRSAAARVALALADRLEVGYWLRADVTGRGYATEATRAMISLASRLPGARHVEIRCDPLNEPSAAVPERLGFRLTVVSGKPSADTDTDMVWIHDLTRSAS